jgi:MFS family permease
MPSRYRLAGYLTGATLARTGDELSGPALLLLGLTAGPHAGAALLAGLTAAAAAGGPVFGALLDRSPAPGRLLAVALAGYAGGIALVTAVFGHLPLGPVVALAVLTGLLNPAIAGGWTAQLPSVAGPALATASRLDALTFTAAALAGPGLAALLATLAGAPAALAVAVGMVAAALPVAWTLPQRPRPAAVRLKKQLADGFGILLRNTPLRRATAASTISCAGAGMVTVCYPLLGAAHLGSAASGTLLMTVLAGASLLANAVFARTPLAPDTVVRVSTLVLAASCVVAATATGRTLLIVAAVLAGFAEGPQLTALFAIRHRETPERVRAQVFTTAASVKITGLAAGAALAGPLAARSVPACLVTAAVVQLLAAVTCGKSQKAIAWARRFTSVPWLVRSALTGVLPGSESSVAKSQRSISVRLNPESASTVIVPDRPLTTPSLTRNALGTHSSPPRLRAISSPSRSSWRTLLVDVPRAVATSGSGSTAMSAARTSSATGIPLTGDTVPHSLPPPATAHG